VVDRSGRVIAMGDAANLGSQNGVPAVALSPTPTGNGYWIADSNGGVYNAGDAAYYGSAAGLGLKAPIIGMATAPSGAGYWLVAGDGGVFAFGDASFAGSAAQSGAGPIVALTRTPNANGYEVATSDGRVLAFSTTPMTCPSWVSACASAAGAPAVARGESPIANDLLSRANAERAARGIAPLTYDPVLANLAGDWARTMGNGVGFKHRDLTPVIQSPYFVGYQGLAENIYRGTGSLATSGAAHIAWMQADGHRSNLLNPGYDSIGVGVYCAADGQLWLTVNFGRVRGSAAPAIASGVPPAAPLTQSGAGISC
jgi:uncharacterized protein YkwD